MPGDIDSAVEALDGAFRYDLEDLERVASQGQRARQGAAGRAWKIIDADVAAFLRGRDGRVADPSVMQLRDRFESHRQTVLREKPDANATEATRLLVNRLLHDPSDELRRLAQQSRRDSGQAHRLLRRLFRLGDDDHEDPESGAS